MCGLTNPCVSRGSSFIDDFWVGSDSVFINDSESMVAVCTDKSVCFVNLKKKLVFGRPILGGIEGYKLSKLRENPKGGELTYPRGELK